MRVEIKQFCISVSCTVKDALAQIDNNKHGFVVVIDDLEIVQGVLTDGDIRRALLAGYYMDVGIRKVIKKKPKMVVLSDTLEKTVELFRDERIRFLPVVDENGKIMNIITKNQLHTVLLLDIQADLTFDFQSLDVTVLDQEVFLRPWGFFKTTILNDYYQGKIISIKPGEMISLQSHNHREEYWVVIHGVGKIWLDDSITMVGSGSTVYIPKRCKHRISNTDKKENLIISEVQIGDNLGEDDIIRYEDIYNRQDDIGY